MSNEQHLEYTKSLLSDKNFTREQRLEKVFYKTLDRMGNGIRDNIILQKIDVNNNISIIHYNKDGSVSIKPCN